MEILTKVIAWVAGHVSEITYFVVAYWAVIGFFEHVAQLTESKKDDAIVGKIRGVSIVIIKLLAKPFGIDLTKINFGE